MGHRRPSRLLPLLATLLTERNALSHRQKGDLDKFIIHLKEVVLLQSQPSEDVSFQPATVIFSRSLVGSGKIVADDSEDMGKCTDALHIDKHIICDGVKSWTNIRALQAEIGVVLFR